MQKIFVTSDTHFGHARIIELCNRPFSSVEEMDRTLIQNWNRVVGKHDFVYHLGDFQNGKVTDQYFNQLNGIKFLVPGNHDGDNTTGLPWCGDSMPDIRNLHYGRKKFRLCHYPMEDWNGMFRGSIHLHGHTHNSTHVKQMKNRFNMGVEVNNYTPVNLDDIIKMVDGQ
jgi:calcineurin-like phosphoesterase family protein